MSYTPANLQFLVFYVFSVLDVCCELLSRSMLVLGVSCCVYLRLRGDSSLASDMSLLSCICVSCCVSSFCWFLISCCISSFCCCRFCIG